MSNVLDAVSGIERIRLTAQLAAQTKALKDAKGAIERVRVSSQIAQLVRKLGEDAPAKIRSFGWDAVKLADLSMDDLQSLRKQVEAEHANPRDEKGRYLEGGQPTINLYDKKGRKKLDALGWAVTYKLQEKRSSKEKEATPSNPHGVSHASTGLPLQEAERQEGKLPEAGADINASGGPPEIIEHITGKGKTLRGIVRTDLTYAQAKEIDPYTFKKSGGYFIRERHLDGYQPTDPAPKPELTPEQQAQTEADRLANEQLKQAEKRAAQVSKLRDAAQATIDKAEEELGRDRNTNTSRRANMAANIMERNEQARALGKTMQNLADAIESGEAKHLAGVTSRAAVETLHRALMTGFYEADKGLGYAEQVSRKGRPPVESDAKMAKFPTPLWGSAGASLAKVLEAIKGKRGSVELAKQIRFSPGPNAETFKALRDMVGKKEAESLIGWYSVEMLARGDRLRRAGINNTEELQAVLIEYLQFREGARKEDPVKAAERAIIGQKVGIDFFPTPSSEAQRMVRMADIQPGERVLEPSAGNGNIADAAAAAGAKVDVIEISSQLRTILEAKGYDVVAHDFMQYQPSEKYGAVLMNPPFGTGTQRLDALHIQHAFGMLKSGGRLVAIAGEGVFIGTDKKAVEFREWLESHAAEVEQLPQGTFMDNKLLARTSANGRLLVMQKN